MGRHLVTLTLLLASAARGAPAGDGSERTDANSRAAHAQLLRKAQAGRIDVYFLGDSITRRWGTADAEYADLYANWRRNFYGWNAADFGWGGDTTWNILWRIEHGELDGVNPKVIVLLAGTNDLSALPRVGEIPDEATSRIAAGVAAIAQVCRQKAPRATLLITSIPPRGDRAELWAAITRINAQVAALADGRQVRYLELAARLRGADGRVLPGMMSDDGIHLALAGYQQWAELLRPILHEVLGPPQPIDVAPPPSRNPGVS